MVVHRGITSLTLAQIPGSDDRIEMVAHAWPAGGTPPQDLFSLLRIVRWMKPKRIFEIGTSQGVTTAHLALNSNAEIYTLDLPREKALDTCGYSDGDLQLLQSADDIGCEYRRLCPGKRITQLFGDSRSFDYSPYRGAMDLVIVDGCHIYDGVISDSRNAFDLLSKDGIILWHDFANLREVTWAMRSIAKERSLFHLEGTWFALFVRGKYCAELTHTERIGKVGLSE